MLSVPELEAYGEGQPVSALPPGPEDIACIMYTSGTTGDPKGVLPGALLFFSMVVGWLKLPPCLTPGVPRRGNNNFFCATAWIRQGGVVQFFGMFSPFYLKVFTTYSITASFRFPAQQYHPTSRIIPLICGPQGHFEDASVSFSVEEGIFSPQTSI